MTTAIYITGGIFSWLIDLINVLRKTVRIWDLIDILLVTYVIYELIQMTKQTRVNRLLRGLAVLIIVFFLSGPEILDLKTIYFLMRTLLQFGLLAVVVIFQPEIRRALEQVGNTRFQFFSLLASRMNLAQSEMWRDAVVTICDASERMARSKTGALIVVERFSPLIEVGRTGTKLDAEITTELLETIFYEGSPLHDGAVIVSRARISEAGCLLPVSQNLDISKDMGTRHRAAIGMSEVSDALIVVISEETGIISLAQNGVILRRLDRANLYRILEGDLIPKEEEDPNKKGLWERLFHQRGNGEKGKVRTSLLKKERRQAGEPGNG